MQRERNPLTRLTAVTLFASGGIADLALRAAGYDILVANELLEERARIFEYNFSETQVFVGDVCVLRTDLVRAALSKLAGNELDLLFATPPCQGMSKNGRGKLLNGIRAGIKPQHDSRNQLISQVIDIAIELEPRLIVLENVPEMQYTDILDNAGQPINIMDLIATRLPAYRLHSEVVEFADYGVPERRKRLITVLFKNAVQLEHVLPPRTHSQRPTLFQQPWVTVTDVIGRLPPLDAKNKQLAKSSLEYHSVPVLSSDKYFWVSNTPVGASAFDNQCVNPSCGYSGNTTHGSSYIAGINRPKTCTPLYCEKCSALLPRPWVRSGETYTLMKGFTSAYKRMRGDLPASALTRNLSYACSDQKLHPTQNRVLSLREAFAIHTIDQFVYRWKRSDGKHVSDKTIREVIGESVPPAGLLTIMKYLTGILRGEGERSIVVPRKKRAASVVS